MSEMRIWARQMMLILLTLSLGLPARPMQAAPPLPPPGPVGDAWALFRTFHEDLSRIDRARGMLGAVAARSPSLDALLLLSWVQLTWADLRASNREERLAGYERGRDLAKRAIELSPRNPDAHFWYAANLGRWALLKGKMQTAFLLSTIKEEIRVILELDPTHVAGLALAGSFYLETPGILGGDVATAETYERKALAVDPHFTRARVELAKCLIAQNRHAEARQELRKVLDETQPSYYADWMVRHRPRAERLLAQIRDKS